LVEEQVPELELALELEAAEPTMLKLLQLK
jgi:hypothetical protein